MYAHRLTSLIVLTALGALGGAGTALKQIPGAGPFTTQAATKAKPDDAALQSALDKILDNPRLQNGDMTVMVRDAATGKTLYRRHPDARANPASTDKIFTSTAAMGTLGPKSRFTTSVAAKSQPKNGTLKADLYLRGGGDPTLRAGDYRELARELHKAGVRKVTGDLVADDSYFDHVPLGPGWSWDNESSYFSAITSGLTLAPNTDYDSGTVEVRSTPGKRAGSKVTLAFAPKTGVLNLVNHARTGKVGSKNTIDVERTHGTNTVTVSGSIPAGADAVEHLVTVPDPTRYATDVFKRALKAEGIRLSGHVTTGKTPAQETVLASHKSMTLSKLLAPFLKLSNNMHAEDLTKAMGRHESGSGSWDAGTTAITDFLNQEGVATSGMQLRDGSGLSRLDLVSARDVTDALLAARKQPWFSTWYKALPIAGNPNRMVGGTLRDRMQDTPAANNLHGKTGSLTSVSGLSGYVTNADGHKLVFSMLSNNYLGDDPKDIEDAVGVTLASWSEKKNTTPAVSPKRLGHRMSYGPQGIECTWAKAC